MSGATIKVNTSPVVCATPIASGIKQDEKQQRLQRIAGCIAKELKGNEPLAEKVIKNATKSDDLLGILKGMDASFETVLVMQAMKKVGVSFFDFSD